MKNQLLRKAALIIAVIGMGQLAVAQNAAPDFVKFVKNDGTELDRNNLTISMTEGETASLAIYATDPDGDVAHIVATGDLKSAWMYFISPSGSSSATLRLYPNDDAQGDYDIVFSTFDDDLSHTTPATASLHIHVTDRNALAPSDTKLTLMNYPNPVADVTTFDFIIPQDGRYTIKIYTLSGREVMTVADASKVGGHYFIKADLSSLPSGVYECSLRLEGVGHQSIRLVKL